LFITGGADTAAFRQISSSRGPVYYDLPNRGGAPIGPGGSLPPLFEAKGWGLGRGGEGSGGKGREMEKGRDGKGEGRRSVPTPDYNTELLHENEFSSVQLQL